MSEEIDLGEMLEEPKPDTVDVFGWLADRHGCGTLRVMQPLDALEDIGLKVSYSEAMKVQGFMPKVLVGQRVCKNLPTKLWQSIAAMDKRPKLVYELDDDLWNIDSSNETAYDWFINGYDRVTGESHNVVGNIEENIRVADRVTCTTQAIADIVSQWNDNVVIVPNYIQSWLTDYERNKRDRFTIGWMGSATHNMDWDQASSPVRRFLNRNEDVDFHIIGAEYGQWLKLPKDQVVETGWVQGVENVWRKIDFDIGLAPLRPHIFNRAKSSLKFMEYSSLGIPTVASDVGPYADAVQHGVTGFLVKRDHEWGKYLRMLKEDDAMREEMGAAARAWAKTQTLEGHIGEWKAAFGEW